MLFLEPPQKDYSFWKEDILIHKMIIILICLFYV